MRRARPASWSLPLLLCACAGPQDPVNFLDGLRMLAVRAEPAEPSFGELVTLSVLGLDAARRIDALGCGPAGDEVIEYEWYSCRTTAGECGPIDSASDAGDRLQHVGSGASITIPFVFDLSPSLFQSLDSTNGVYQPYKVVARAPGLNPGDPERVLSGIQRIRIKLPNLPNLPSNPANRNPELARLLVLPAGAGDLPDGGPRFVAPGDFSVPFDCAPPADLFAPDDGGAGESDGGEPAVRDAGAPPDMSMPAGAPRELVEARPIVVRAGDEVIFRPLFVDGAVEDYDVLQQFPPESLLPKCTVAQKSEQGEKYDLFRCRVSERLTVRWFTTAGIFRNPVTGIEVPDTVLTFNDDKLTRQSAHLPEPGTTVHVFVVAHDERAGTSWMRRTLIFR